MNFYKPQNVHEHILRFLQVATNQTRKIRSKTRQIYKCRRLTVQPFYQRLIAVPASHDINVLKVDQQFLTKVTGIEKEFFDRYHPKAQNVFTMNELAFKRP